MIDKWRVTTAPALEPVTLTEMKLDMRVDCSDDDALITSLIVAARQACEDYEHRAYVTQTITAKLDYLPTKIILPKPRLQSVTSVTYTDSGGDVQTLSSALYQVSTYREPGEVVIAYNANYPGNRDYTDSVTIVYKAGYGDAASNVPDITKTAIKLMCAHLYDNRSALTDTQMYELPFGVKSLLNARAWTV